MNRSLHKWLTTSFFNLFIVAFLGVVLRYKIAFYLPFVQQKFLLHSHSHFAFSGWITQTLMVLLIHHISLHCNEHALKRYQWLLYANLFSAYGMLISFIIQGYAFFSITFSTLSIIVSYFFAFYYWKDLNTLLRNKISSAWLKAALAFSVISSAGPFFLAYLMIAKISDQHLYLSSIYFFLHFQYNGWFFFAGMGLLISKLEHIPGSFSSFKTALVLFFVAAFPAYFLSVLWLPLPLMAQILIVIAVVCQLLGWAFMVKFFTKNKIFIKTRFSKYGRILLLLSAIAFSLKLLLQAASVHPALSQLTYGFRPIIIGYLHLVLLAVISIFIVGYIVSFDLVRITHTLLIGISIFVVGVIINEFFLMIQGIEALQYRSVHHINELLFAAAIILFSGIATMFISSVKSFNRDIAQYKTPIIILS